MKTEYDDRKYIVRAAEAGVFYGRIAERDGDEVSMTDARCIWKWEGAATLLQLAGEGVKSPDACRFTVRVPEITIIGVCEIIPCSDEAVACIEEVAEWRAQ
jgi:hypothetical protein